MKLTHIAAMAGVALAAFAVPAAAQDDGDPYAPCAAMSDNAARLACFDSTYDRQIGVRAERARRQAEEARLAEARRIEEERLAAERAEQEYGLRETREQRANNETTESVSSPVQDAFTDGRGRALVTLENGQIWREVNGSSMRNPPREGWVATVEAHWSGAFTMSFEGRRGFLRVERYR